MMSYMLTAEDVRYLLEKRNRRWPTHEFLADRLAARARRIESGRRLSDLSLPEYWSEYLPMAGGATSATITLDTTAPAWDSTPVSIDAGAAYTTDRDVTVAIDVTDGDTTGYQIKVWGSVDTADNASIQATEGASSWISFTTSQAVKLSTGDGAKTINVKVRDDVWNESSTQSDTITLDTSAPVPNITVAPSPSKISKVTGKDQSSFTWQVDVGFEEYKVKRVANSSDPHTAGTLIPTAGGSTNVSGNAGSYPATTGIVTMIDGTDLESAGSEGANIVKVFVRDAANNWSV